MQNVAKGVMVCLCTLDLWHCRQDCAHLRISVFNLGHIYRLVIKRSVDRTLGWERECRLSNTAYRNDIGTTDCGTPAERS